MSDYSWQNPRVFNYFLDFPPGLQMMVVDEMQPIERCKFAGCSKLSNKLGKASRNYIYELGFDDSSADFIKINVVHINEEKTTEKWIGFLLLFYINNNKKFIECKRIERESRIGMGRLWKIDLDISVNLAQTAAEHFKTLLQVHQNNVKKIDIGGTRDASCSEINDFDFGIERLTNLETLFVRNDINISQFISKIRHPLEDFYVRKEENNRAVADWEGIYNVRNCLILPYLKLNNEQFSRLCARDVDIPIGYLTEEDVFHFIKSWQNGTKRVDINVDFNLTGSNFNVQKLLELLGKSDFDIEEDALLLDTYVYSGYDALLLFNRGRLSFQTLSFDDPEYEKKDDDEEDEAED